MKTVPASAGLRSAGPRPAWSASQWAITLWAQLRGPALDRQLAREMASWASPLHAARALQITSPRRRRLLADSLERLLDDVRRPARGPRLGAAVPPDRQQINAAASQIEALATRLRDGEPVRAEGVARLRALLCDGAGPVYTPSRSPDLPGALDAVARWLNVED
jgi:hypothetical protein